MYIVNTSGKKDNIQILSQSQDICVDRNLITVSVMYRIEDMSGSHQMNSKVKYYVPMRVRE